MLSAQQTEKHLYLQQCVRSEGTRMGGDARRLAWGCKFRILISLRVFRALYLAAKVSFRVARKLKKFKIYIFNMYIFNSFHLMYIKVFVVSCRGKKCLGHAQSVTSRVLIRNYRQASTPFSYASLSPNGGVGNNLSSFATALRAH